MQSETISNLPLPKLDYAAETLLRWLSVYEDQQTQIQTKKLLDLFIKDDAQVLYDALEAQIKNTRQNNLNWMDNVRRQKYLGIREPLAISVCHRTMQIKYDTPQRGLKKVAHFLTAAIKILHSYEINSENEKSSDFEVLRGAFRRPGEVKDELIDDYPELFLPRFIIVLINGNAYKIQVSDGSGETASPAQIETALYEILDQAKKIQTEIPFSTPALLDAQTALEVRTQMISRGENSKIFQDVEKSMFIVSLSELSQANADAFFDAAFGNGEMFWSYKAINFCIYLKDEKFFVHYDQTAVKSYVIEKFIQEIKEIQKTYEIETRKNKLPDQLETCKLTWTIDGANENAAPQGTMKILSDGLIKYMQKTETFAVSEIDYFITDEEVSLLEEFDSRAVFNIILQASQMMLYGEIRPICEQIDLQNFSEYPMDLFSTVSSDTIKCVEVLNQNIMTKDYLHAACMSYKKRIQNCRRANGIISFWLAMENMAKVQQLDIEFFNSSKLQLLYKPFIYLHSSHNNNLSVSVPMFEDGFMITYYMEHNHFRAVFTHKRAKNYEVKMLMNAMRDTLKSLLLMLRIY